MILQQSVDEQHVDVVFRLPTAIWADRIDLVGDFNGWRGIPMHQHENYWEAHLTLEAGTSHAYAYLIDGVDWCTDRNVGAAEPSGAVPPIAFTSLMREQLQQRVVA